MNMDMSKIFDGFDPSAYAQEAEQRWGDTGAYGESRRCTASYGADDWKRLRDEQAALYREAARLLQAGTPPESDAATAIADRLRSLIDRWFYPCTREMHAKLADLYEADHRFADNIDKHGGGLTTFLVKAIRANAAVRQR